MNRIKVLLTAVGVLTIVGSALAYSGSLNVKICYVSRPPSGCSSTLQCTTFASNKRIISGNQHCYEIVPASATSCSGFHCPNEGTVVDD
jgi:hypothetical protein